jgi:hypothetical protein
MGPNMKQRIAKFTGEVAQQLGLDFAASFSIPLFEAIEQLSLIALFLDNVLGTVIAVFVGLGALLIYSLMINDVETKTYEYGMLRALGMRNRSIMQLLITKSALYALPGIAAGLTFAFLLSLPVVYFISGYANFPLPYALSTSAVSTAVLVGLCMPFVSNLMSIQRALSSTLRDSLDVYHQVTSGVTVKMLKLSDLGLDLWQSALAILLILTGFVTFFVVPYAFIFRDLNLFFLIFNVILIGMLIGLCIVAQLLQPWVERVVLHFVTLPHRNLKRLVAKNLSGHRRRNAKTAQMFTILLGFMLFAGVMLELQASNLGDNIKVLLGADIVIQASGRDDYLQEEVTPH